MGHILTDIQKQAIKDHNASLKAIKETFKNVTVDFNDIVINAVKLLWDNGQISVVNRTMDTLQHLKGADNRALATYFMKCIPHTFDKEQGRFGKKNPMTAKKMDDTWGEFILTNDWYDESKVKSSKPYELTSDKVIQLVASTLKKGRESEKGDQVTNELLDAIAVGINKVLNEYNVEPKVEESEETDDTTTTSELNTDEEIKSLMVVNG